MNEFAQQTIEFISQPWPWWMGGVVIGLTLFLLFFFDKEFGLSANLRTMCAADGAGDYVDFFKFDWSKQGWNLMVAFGATFGGYMAANYFGGDDKAHVSPTTIELLNEIAGEEIFAMDNLPPIVPGTTVVQQNIHPFWDIYSWQSLFTVRGFIIIIIGGFMIGFGARYAGGCTSGHAISGLADLQVPSLVAVSGFFIGGLIMTWLFLPSILRIAF
ncbi:MAG: YeeE/YedE thiosulfate transporter family protein [Cyclobacteriaceae bacterium]|nr:YeeE/YedE thiosulfate transporter family protein [Cyclobacteriaceae bacterium]